MKKNYITLLTTIAFLFTAQYHFAQNKNLIAATNETIAGLTIYPNPINSQDTYLYISSKTNTPKYIEIYNVLGKRLLSKNMVDKELNISQFSKGIYILKITENNKSVTKKLVVQ